MSQPLVADIVDDSESAKSAPALASESIVKNKLTVLFHPERRNRRAVVFVHGFTGAGTATWSDGATSFQQLVATDPTLIDFDVFTFQYQTKLLKGSPIHLIAKQLGGALEQLRDWASRHQRAYELVFIAHSMGGLVCMRFILDSLTDGRVPPVVGLMLYETPMNGSEMVKVARYASVLVGLRVPLLRALIAAVFRGQRQIGNMKPASQFMQALHDQWAKHVLNGGHEDAADRRMWLPVRVLTGNQNLVVSEASGKGLYGAIDWQQMDYNHLQICKPTEVTDERYLYARSFLNDCRDAKDRGILDRLSQLSGGVWRTRREKLIRNWQFYLELFKVLPTAMKAWSDHGFTGCTVSSRYTTRLTDRTLRVGAAFGRIATQTAWQQGPAYVHQVNIDGVPKEEQSELTEYVDTRFRDLDGEACWTALFARFDVSLVFTSDSPGRKHVVALEYDRTDWSGNALTRHYRLPAENDDLIGADVEVHVIYESVVPAALDSFHAFFPWLTHGCDMHIIVWRQCSFFVAVPKALNAGAIEVGQPEVFKNKAAVRVSSKELLLPFSEVAMRWGLTPPA